MLVMNLNKFRTCQFLIEYHEKRNDKIIVIADNFRPKPTPEVFKDHFSQDERMLILNYFKNNPKIKTIFVSKIVDNYVAILIIAIISSRNQRFG